MQNINRETLFTIITPTYNRPDALLKCLRSVIAQKHTYWRIIIINDSPDYNYNAFEENEMFKLHSSNIVYIKNQNNMGVNFSRNVGLDYINQYPFRVEKGGLENENEYAVFLDDDDWLAPNALEKLNKILKNISQKENYKWLIANRSLLDGTSLSHIGKQNKDKCISSFNWEFLLLRQSSGDVTHAIERRLALSARFSKKVKQGEEWLYFSQLDSSIHYKNINTTVSQGYAENGLNSYMTIQDRKQKIKNIIKLFTEVKNKKMRNRLTIYLYLKLRLIKTVFC